jgi:hypothetical protein
MADSTIPFGESPQKDMTRAERDPKKRTMKGKGRGGWEKKRGENGEER